MTYHDSRLKYLHKLRGGLFSRAKSLWGLGTLLGYFAIGAVPTAFLFGWQEWAGPLAAGVFAISGRMLVWWSETYREDAEWTLRTIELNRGIDLEIDAIKLANVKSKYLHRLRNHDSSLVDNSYYEATGNPSPDLLIRMGRESAWWTEQLAKKASKTVFIVLTILALMSVLAIAFGALEGESGDDLTPEVFRRAYGLAICAILLLDTSNLGVKYSKLSVAAQESMGRLSAILKQGDDLSASALMAIVSEYQSARRQGPLIPDWFKCYHEKTLQRVWDETLSTEEDSG